MQGVIRELGAEGVLTIVRGWRYLRAERAKKFFILLLGKEVFFAIKHLKFTHKAAANTDILTDCMIGRPKNTPQLAKTEGVSYKTGGGGVNPPRGGVCITPCMYVTDKSTINLRLVAFMEFSYYYSALRAKAQDHIADRHYVHFCSVPI